MTAQTKQERIEKQRREVDAYIDGVLSGEIVAGRLVKLAVQRHRADLERQAERGIVFREEIAENAIRFIETVCHHSTGEWKGKLLILSPWQRFIVWVLFGWRKLRPDGSVGPRRFAKAHIEIARKNGKSTIVSAIGLLLLVCDFPVEERAEVYVAATKEAQAMIVHSEAVRMVKQSPSLRKIAKVYKGNHRIVLPHNDSIFVPLGSDSDSQDGLNPHAVLKDELHAWRERHRGLNEKLSSGGATRTQPLEVIITTAGDDNSEIWKEERNASVQVVESVISGNIIDDSRFVFIACLDDEDSEFDEAAWPKANPNIYAIPTMLDYLRKQANEAQYDPTKLNQWKRYHCNRQVAASEKAINPEDWQLGNRPLTEGLERIPCRAGLDLGRSNDFASVTLVWPFDVAPVETTEPEEYELGGSETRALRQRYELKSWSFTCEKRSEELMREPMATWVRRGLLHVSKGDQIDFAYVENFLIELTETYQIQSWAFDPKFALLIAQNLQEKHGQTVYPFPQHCGKYNEPMRTYRRAIRAGLVVHAGDPLLEWQAGNLCVYSNNRDEWMPDKKFSSGKIDAQVAAVMGVSECLFSESMLASYQPGSLAL